MSNRLLKALAVAFAFAASSFGANTSSSIDALVASNYPQTLTARATRDRYVDARQQKYVVVGTKSEQFIVAAYSNGHIGAVVLLAAQTNTVTLLDSAPYAFLGSAPDVWLRDLDGDGSPDVIVEFDIGKGGAETWAFKIADRKVRLMTPVDMRLHAILRQPSFMSMGEGRALDVVETVNLGSRRDPVHSHLHYVLQNGTFTQVAPLDFYKEFRRTKGGPATESVMFDIPADALGKPYRLVVANGGSFGAEQRASSGEVRLNGVLVSAASDFSQTRATWSIPVSVQPHNTVAVRLSSAPGSTIAVAIRHD
jgi:hypothetical protein